MAADEVIPAATVVVIRDGPDGVETLVLHRNAALAFGGMWVFPGGRIDASDGDDVDAPRRAAVREAREEAGLELDSDQLIPISHWVPPHGAPRRYGTYFFLAAAPDAHEVAIDGGEIHDHAWVSAADMLERQARGEVELAPPTWVTLHELAEWGSVDEALAAARRLTEVPVYESQLAHLASGELATLWVGDVAYGTGIDPDAPGARHRLVLGTDGWRFERRLP